LLAKYNLAETKKKDHENINEKLHLALRWGIGDIKEDYRITNTKIWNDTNKVDFYIILFLIYRYIFIVID
jgi:hypothetical protein